MSLLQIKLMQIKKEAIIICVSVAIGLAVTSLITMAFYSEGVSKRISERFIRLHVVANSDTDADQLLKLKVRDGVLKLLEGDVAAAGSIGETREMLANSLGKIEQTAEEIIESEGYSYSVHASLEHTMFPTRRYGDVALVAGMYEALRIEIGAGSGQNWWCVVYPPLCYVDVSQKRVSASLDLSAFEGEDYKLITEADDYSVKVKFKVVELWQEGKAMALAALEK